MKLRSGAAFLLMICLILFSVCLGAYRGWSDERAQVEESLSGLESMIASRVECAWNILAVAGRHLPETDEDFVFIAQARDILSGSGTLSEKAAADALLSESASRLLQRLCALPSVLQDSRDLMYAESYLPQMLSESEERTASSRYNAAAADFNHQLQESFSGAIARLLGVEPAEEFIAN